MAMALEGGVKIGNLYKPGHEGEKKQIFQTNTHTNTHTHTPSLFSPSLEISGRHRIYVRLSLLSDSNNKPQSVFCDSSLFFLYLI
jgi:hypothetical protein